MKVLPPLYLVGKKIYCWKCAARMPAVALLAQDFEDADEYGPCVFSNVEHIPASVLKYIQGRVPTFRLRYSKTVRANYFANTCPQCGVISGDFHLHSEPGGPFFPTEEDEAQSLYLTEIPLSGPVTIRGAPGFGTADLILAHAKRIT